jgi:hypothetical protein
MRVYSSGNGGERGDPKGAESQESIEVSLLQKA